jgi:hypothetical protein
MLKSEFVKRLLKEIDQFGDEYIRSFKVVQRNETWQYSMLSKTRKNTHGYKANMNNKEFSDYCDSNPIKKENKND